MSAKAPNTMTRRDLAEKLHLAVGLPRSDSLRFVEQVLAHMCETLESGESVKITGFGSFNLLDQGERPGRNPKTGDAFPIAQRRVVKFHASGRLRSLVVAADEPGSDGLAKQQSSAPASRRASPDQGVPQ